MIDRSVCDERLPGKWRSSFAVIRCRPEDDYQEFDEYDITFLKVAWPTPPPAPGAKPTNAK